MESGNNNPFLVSLAVWLSLYSPSPILLILSILLSFSPSLCPLCLRGLTYSFISRRISAS